MNGHEGHEDCNHDDMQMLIIRLTEEVIEAAMMTTLPMVASGEMDRGGAGMGTATMIFLTALETGIRSALIDPIGAQMIIDYLNDQSSVVGKDLEEANMVLASDARRLLEEVARL